MGRGVHLWNHVTKVGINEPSIELPPDALSPEHTKQMGHYCMYIHTEEGTENTVLTVCYTDKILLDRAG